jgi:hypothetical protein
MPVIAALRKLRQKDHKFSWSELHSKTLSQKTREKKVKPDSTDLFLTLFSSLLHRCYSSINFLNTNLNLESISCETQPTTSEAGRGGHIGGRMNRVGDK